MGRSHLPHSAEPLLSLVGGVGQDEASRLLEYSLPDIVMSLREYMICPYRVDRLLC